MSWFFSAMTGRSAWQTFLVEDKQAYIEKHKPEFLTILDCNAKWGKGEKPPEHLAYRGPMYFDWDGDGDIQAVLDDVKRFISNLESLEFDVNQASWWLSGKKGVHCTIPMNCFLNAEAVKTASVSGIAHLPDIYRKMAFDMITTYLDMRVYTSKRGRMWRTTYRARILDNGQSSWKVAISPEQLKELDEDGYWDWCSKPRPDVIPHPPTENLQLKTVFSLAHSSVTEIAKSKKKTKHVDFSEWTETPPTIKAAFDGLAILDSKNLNDIKLQLATAAVASGMDSLDDEDKYIEAINGFVEGRIGASGATHKTRESIEQAMRAAFRYVAENPYFSYNARAFSSILKNEYSSASDLFGIKQDDVEQKTALKKGMAGGVLADSMGVILLSKEGDPEPLADYSWKPGSLMVIRDDVGRITHYSVVPMIDTKELPRLFLTLDELSSQARFTLHVLSLGGNILGLSSKELSRLRQALLNYIGQTAMEAPRMLSTTREGLDLIVVGDVEKDGPNASLDRMWVEADETISRLAGEGVCLTYMDPSNPGGIFSTDLSKTGDTLTTTKSPMKDTIRHLLELNGNKYSLSVLLGWFTACNLKHILYNMNVIKNFPLLQVVGQAGSGKTTTVNLLLNLFSYRKEMKVLAAGNSLTRFGLEKRLTSTTSIPVVVDEVKQQNIGSAWMQEFRGLLQTVYTIGSTVSKGGGKGIGSHYSEMNNDPMLAPMAWLGESLDTSQSSLLERLVPAMFHVDDKIGRSEHAKWLQQHNRCISVLGWTLVRRAMTCDLTKLRDLYNRDLDEVEKLLYTGSNDRIVENAGMVTVGFDFFCDTIKEAFPTEFDQTLDAMRNALLDTTQWTTEVAPEVVRFLEFMQHATLESDTGRGRVVKGTHYDFVRGEGPKGVVDYLVISSDRMYFIYRERCKIFGITPVYNAETELFQTLKNSSLAVDSYDDPILGKRCVKLDPQRMLDAGIPKFSKK